MWKLLTALVPLTLLLWGLSGYPLALLGAVLGGFACLALLVLGQVLGALARSVRVSQLTIGVGSELKTWNGEGRRVVLRSIPLLFTVILTSVKSPARPRLWGTALTAVLLTAAAVAAAWFAASSPLARGFAVAGTAVLVNALVPRRGAGLTSMGWFLFALPRLSGRPLAELEATPAVNRAVTALESGDLDEAERIADELVAAHPDLLVAIGSKTGVLTLRGKHAEALKLVSSLVGRPDLNQRDMAFLMAEMASTTANAVEAGMLPAEVGLGAAQRALDGAIQLGFPSYRCSGVVAQLSLITGDVETALRMARQAAEVSESSLSRADALASVARAHMAAGDNAAAREALAEAERLAGWSPRVAETSARLNIA
ncbi:hypothetical protein [Actinosynnema sp.]|uniref:hypothetical protein n=1 Tax=Actinosynnema sp. TaxID=1872144 RepID=UPI003F862583